VRAREPGRPGHLDEAVRRLDELVRRPQGLRDGLPQRLAVARFGGRQPPIERAQPIASRQQLFGGRVREDRNACLVEQQHSVRQPIHRFARGGTLEVDSAEASLDQRRALQVRHEAAEEGEIGRRERRRADASHQRQQRHDGSVAERHQPNRVQDADAAKEIIEVLALQRFAIRTIASPFESRGVRQVGRARRNTLRLAK
jgi:hypothetical protein